MSDTARASFVVTGGAQGIGRVIAERLSADGHVVILDPAGEPRRDPPITLIRAVDAEVAALLQRAAQQAIEAYGDYQPADVP